MKITIDVDCTPEEARTFFGLPDVKPMQAELMKQLQDRLSKGVAAVEPEAMLKSWLGPMIKGFEQWQEAFLPGAGSSKK